MWKKYFKVVKLKPGRVVTALFGELDFSRPDLPIEKVKALWENDFPYLEITNEGKNVLYGVKEIQPKQTDPDPINKIVFPKGEFGDVKKPIFHETAEEVPAPPKKTPRKRKKNVNKS